MFISHKLGIVYKTDAVVLQDSVYNEYDSLISCFTPEFGKIHIKVRSSKKPTTKQGLFLSPFSILHISFILGKQSPILTGVFEQQEHSAISSNVYALGFVGSFFQLVDALVYEYEKDTKLWNLLTVVLLDTTYIISHYSQQEHQIQALWYGEKKWLVQLLHILGSAFLYNEVSYKKKVVIDKEIRKALQQVSNTSVSFFGLSLYEKHTKQ